MNTAEEKAADLLIGAAIKYDEEEFRPAPLIYKSYATKAIVQLWNEKQAEIDALNAQIDKLKWDANDLSNNWTLEKMAGQKMKAEIEQLKADKWISVEDRMPEENSYCIVWCINPNEYGLVHYHKLTGWQNGFYNDRVTHWQKPLPPKS